MNPPLPSRVTAAVAVLAAAVTLLGGCLRVDGTITVHHVVESPQFEQLINIFERAVPASQPANDPNWPLDVAFPR